MFGRSKPTAARLPRHAARVKLSSEQPSTSAWGRSRATGEDTGVPINRHFLTWDEPFLPQLAKWLHDEADAAIGGTVDLSDFLVVLPVSAAKRRLMELLVERTGGRMLPPTLLTPADFPERLYALKLPLATAHTQLAAWTRAIRSINFETLAAAIPNQPAPDATRDWTALAELLAAQHRELARDDFDFQQVAVKLRDLPGQHELARWDVLAEIEQRYLDSLDGVELWDRQKARLTAIDYGECQTNRRVVLAATSDLNKVVQQMVKQAADRDDQSARVDCLVHAAPDAADLFDELGVLDADAWSDYPIEIADDVICRATDADDQAEAVGVALSELGDYEPDEIAIGCPNDRIVEPLRVRLSDVGVNSSWFVGRELLQMPPARLLRAVAGCLERERADAEPLMVLARFPFLGAIWPEGCDPTRAIAELDAYRDEARPRTLDAEAIRRMGAYLQEARSSHEGLEHAACVVETLGRLLEPFDGTKRSAADATRLIRTLLATVFPPDAEQPSDVRVCLRAIDTATHELARIPNDFAEPRSVAEVIGELLGELRGVTASPEPSENAVALTGWLEMPLDDRPVAIVTNFNEGVIPTSVTSDLFLPGSVRAALGMNDNVRRYARDAYATLVLLKSRKIVRLIVPSRDSEGNPLAPSRLLFRTTPAATAKRMRHLLEESISRPSLQTRWQADHARWAVPVPPPAERRRPLDRIAVTAFRAYLACPYRYYLSREERLAGVENDLTELPANQFGNLLHNVLAAFGVSELKNSSDAAEIEAFVIGELATQAKARFGERPLPAIQVQLKQAEQRLRTFAEQQAAHRATGWLIIYSERASDELRVPFALPDGRSFHLVGRIDRVDQHENGSFAVLDYKTGDTGAKPEASHRKSPKKEETRPPEERWLDLQLPLYRYLAGELVPQLGRPADVSLGYFNLPKSAAGAGVQIASFTEAELEEADDLATAIAMQIMDEQFTFDPARQMKYPTFEAICQSSILAVPTRSQQEAV